MDAALARAARVFMRGAFFVFCPADGPDPGGGSIRGVTWSWFAGLGIRTFKEERNAGHYGALRFYSQPALSWQLHNGSWIYHRGWPSLSRSDIRHNDSGHLSSGDARRIAD